MDLSNDGSIENFSMSSLKNNLLKLKITNNKQKYFFVEIALIDNYDCIEA